MPEYISKISVSSWFYYKEICYDARSHERKTHKNLFGSNLVYLSLCTSPDLL